MGEAEDFRLLGEPRRILVTRDLIEELGVTGQPRGEQEACRQGLACYQRAAQGTGPLTVSRRSSTRTCQTACQTNYGGRARMTADQCPWKLPLTCIDTDVGGPGRTHADPS